MSRSAFDADGEANFIVLQKYPAPAWDPSVMPTFERAAQPGVHAFASPPDTQFLKTYTLKDASDRSFTCMFVGIPLRDDLFVGLVGGASPFVDRPTLTDKETQKLYWQWCMVLSEFTKMTRDLHPLHALSLFRVTQQDFHAATRVFDPNEYLRNVEAAKRQARFGDVPFVPTYQSSGPDYAARDAARRVSSSLFGSSVAQTQARLTRNARSQFPAATLEWMYGKGAADASSFWSRVASNGTDSLLPYHFYAPCLVAEYTLSGLQCLRLLTRFPPPPPSSSASSSLTSAASKNSGLATALDLRSKAGGWSDPLGSPLDPGNLLSDRGATMQVMMETLASTPQGIVPGGGAGGKTMEELSLEQVSKLETTRRSPLALPECSKQRCASDDIRNSAYAHVAAVVALKRVSDITRTSRNSIHVYVVSDLNDPSISNPQFGEFAKSVADLLRALLSKAGMNADVAHGGLSGILKTAGKGYQSSTPLIVVWDPKFRESVRAIIGIDPVEREP